MTNITLVNSTPSKISPVKFCNWLRGYLEDRKINQDSINKIKEKLDLVYEEVVDQPSFLSRSPSFIPMYSTYTGPSCAVNSSDEHQVMKKDRGVQ